MIPLSYTGLEQETDRAFVYSRCNEMGSAKRGMEVIERNFVREVGYGET